jgi:flagellar motor protein MotB
MDTHLLRFLWQVGGDAAVTDAAYDAVIRWVLVHREPEIGMRARLLGTQVLTREPSPRTTPTTPTALAPVRAGAVGRRSLHPGRPLDPEARALMEARFGHDFSRVRVHTDHDASALNHALGALAFTVGHDVFFRDGHLDAGTPPGRALLAHELTHVIQQHHGGGEGRLGLGSPGDRYEQEADAVERAFRQEHAGARAEVGGPGSVHHTGNGAILQRRLVAYGTLPDVNALLGLVGPRAGLTLNLNTITNQVQIAAVLPGAPPSPALRTQLTNIISHATQHAEVIVGRGQPHVGVGAFPQPPDLTVGELQRIDIDDILKIEAGAPGSGVAKAAHEIQENFVAHAAVPAAGTSLFPGAHEAAMLAESAVAAELVGPGQRVASVVVSVGPGQTRVIQDFENYYLVYRLKLKAGTQDFEVTSAKRRTKVVISERTIANFGTGSAFSPFAGATVPAAGAAVIAAAAADVAANPSATVRIQGFADDNEMLGEFTSSRRASRAKDSLVAAGVAGGRIHAEGRGRTNFVVPNNSAPNRALNRRVVIRVTRPGV